MWIRVDDNRTIVNTDNVESFEASDKSIYANMNSGKTHFFGRYDNENKAIEALETLRGLLSCS